MQIIVISDRMARARSVTLSLRHVIASALAALVLLAGMTVGLYWVTLRFASEIKIPLLQELVLAASDAESERARQFLQQNLNAMAVKLGEMQAQLARLEALGERLGPLAGMRPQELLRMAEAPGLGGAVPAQLPQQNLSFEDFSEKLTKLARTLENRTDLLGVLEAQLFEQAVRKQLTPTMMPVQAHFNASGFGQRVDPFTGLWAMHEGVDFHAQPGTPIVTAAGGVVVFAGFHPQYGNMIDVDHGNDLVTRYAHASRIFVREGDMIQRGRKIAEVGSTGRSTGPHLHFEVRYRGAAQNPVRFLYAHKDQPQSVARAK